MRCGLIESLGGIPMADWSKKFSKKKKSEEVLKNHILFDDSSADSDTAFVSSDTPSEDHLTEDSAPAPTETEDSTSAPLSNDGDTSFDDTARLDLPPIFSPDAEKALLGEEESPLKAFCKKHRTPLLGGVIAVAGVILISIVIMILSGILNPLSGYTESAVAKGNILPSISTEGTLEANAYYTITSLVSGKVIESVPEIGERVEAGTVLYQLDDTEAQLAVKQAENQLARSKAVGSSSSAATLRIYSTETGVIQSLNLVAGSPVSAGQIVATIKRSDDTVVSVTSMVSGTIASVSARRGRSVAAGSLLATVKDTRAELDYTTNFYDQKSDEYALEVAKKQLESYTIKAPVSGVITEKNTKVGDNVAITDTNKPMMVLVDMESLKFTFSVDETEVKDLSVDQNVIITTESIPNEAYAGKVTRVSGEGRLSEEGKLLFDVDITIDEPGDLKTGMKVQAKVILDSATNVLCLPEKALLNPDGKTAMVLVKEDVVSDTAEDHTTKTEETEEDTAGQVSPFPNIKVPKGCRLVTVRYGITDGSQVEIISGLKQNDVVVYDPEWEDPDLQAAVPTATPSPATINPSEATESPVPTSPAGGTDAATEEELRRQIQDRISQEDTSTTPLSL